MSSNVEHTQSEGFPNSLDTGKLHTSSEAIQPRTELYLDELTGGASGTIIVMICHSWDVHTITRRYLSTDFVMSDAKGNAIHSAAKANVAHNFLRLKEGSVYSIKNFVVQANKEEYRIFRDHAYMCNTPKNGLQRNMFPEALLHNTIAQVMRERPLTVSFKK
ncbi:replication protein A 70 kDa DNA-binding subunit C-like protein, partial [Tanacetum coccineum]